MDKLASISSFLLNVQCTNVFMVGIWLLTFRTVAPCLLNWIIFVGIIILFCPAESPCALEATWHTTSWFNNCISIADVHVSLTQMEILYSLSTSGRIPIKMTISFDNVPTTLKDATIFNPDLVDWSSLSLRTILFIIFILSKCYFGFVATALWESI